MTLAQFPNASVLVIDDNSANVALLRAILGKAGIARIETVTDSTLAVACYDELRPDLVLLDLHMPGVDGFELLAELSGRAGAGYLPILVLTADTTRRAVNRALSLGARDFLTKPIDPTELTYRVKNLLEARQLHIQLRHSHAALRLAPVGYPWSEEAEEDARGARRQQVQQVIDEELLTMAYQPIVDVATLAHVGYEALARFPLEPIQGPRRWFADALDLGLGLELELAAVRQALSVQSMIAETAFLAVNVSPGTAMSAQLKEILATADCSRLIIELAEHVLVDDLHALRDSIEPIREAGVRLAVDDAGAGYAGLRHLQALEPDIIKIDTELSRGIDRDPVLRALAASVVTFAGETGAKVVAEGVENEAELSTLIGLGVSWAQGFHLARPEPFATSPAHSVGPTTTGLRHVGLS